MPGGPAIGFWYALYNVLVFLGVLLSLPVWGVRRLMGRYKGQLAERLGLLPPEVRAVFDGRPALWMHAASAGETAAAAPLVRRLRAAYPDHVILFTVTSKYGKQMAQKQLEGIADAVAFSPFDLPFACRRVLDVVRPRLYAMVETDIWPNLVRMAKRRGARVVIASGHARDASFPRPFWRAVFANVDALFMQTETDARNIVARGALPERVRVGGNLKFDSAKAVVPESERPALRAEFGLPDGIPVFVAGSTLAEDEGPVLDAVAALELGCIIAPRRQERVAAVEQACAERGLRTVRRTQGGGAPVLILDTMGELAGTYNLADAAYVGGGLTPDVGLHNLLEPLVCGAPVLYGPHFGKARRIATEITRAGAGVPLPDGAALTAALRRVLTDDAEHARLVEAGRALLAAHRGAAERQADAISELLG
ncbi:MAG: 3-deoxy-D-manno-octulosonic acid transferase [Planctomycetota bacterium]|jgi:3-deoxy-D-manno-octulosonic-acid transferase